MKTDLLNDAAEFGAQLVKTNDLDPVYVMLHRTPMGLPVLERFLFAYWCFYHTGTAAWIASSRAAYWDRFRFANETNLPRSSERRHFRGKASMSAIDQYENWGKKLPGSLFEQLAKANTYDDVVQVLGPLPLFGPWIMFKVADMLERLDLVPIEFSEDVLTMYSEPRKGAALLLTGDPETTLDNPREEMHEVVVALRKHPKLRRLKAPPRLERLLSFQEIETILCKFKSHWKGHYKVGEDVEALRKATQWCAPTSCPLLRQLYEAAP